MMTRTAIAVALIIGVVTTGLFGCAPLGNVTSPQTAYYVLASTAVAPAASAGNRLSDRVIGVGPVTLAGYLNRPQMVTRISGNEVKTAEFARWAEPLKDNIARVVGANIAALTGSDHVFHFPWKRSVPVDYQVTLDVLQMDRTEGVGPVTLIAQWAIYGAGGEGLLLNRRERIEAAVDGGGNAEAAAAMSRALAQLSIRIVSGLSDVAGSI